jgi:hypothetical protein
LITPSEFLANYDEFQSLEEAKIQAAINEAVAFVPDTWGKKYTQAVSLITAHILAMRWLQVGVIAATAVQNAKGKASSDRMDSDNWLSGTAWGQQYIQLRRGIVVSGFVP